MSLWLSFSPDLAHARVAGESFHLATPISLPCHDKRTYVHGRRSGETGLTRIDHCCYQCTNNSLLLEVNNGAYVHPAPGHKRQFGEWIRNETKFCKVSRVSSWNSSISVQFQSNIPFRRRNLRFSSPFSWSAAVHIRPFSMTRQILRLISHIPP